MLGGRTEIAPGSSGPVLETTVGGVLREAAERAADSERAARALLGRFAPGERVAVWAPNSAEWFLLEFGAALAGLTLVTVVPGRSVTPEELTLYCRAQLAAHKIPRHWRFADTFPLTASGKVQKFVLRERFA